MHRCLISLLSQIGLADGHRIGMFSYGSGCTATFYTIQVYKNEALEQMQRVLREVPKRLEARSHITPGKGYREFPNLIFVLEQMEKNCEMRETANRLTRPNLAEGWQPTGPISAIEPGATYLQNIDSKWRRFYSVHSDLNGNLWNSSRRNTRLFTALFFLMLDTSLM